MMEAEEGEIEEEDHVGQEAKEVKFECMPCEKEVRLHNLNHIPFRSWCPYCVQGKAVTGAHRKKKDEDEDEVTVISIDYAGMKVREPEEDSFPIIVIHDRRSKACFAHLVPRKGVNEYAVKRVTQDLQKVLGYGPDYVI